MTITLLQGNALDRLKDLEDNSIQMCVTSPPFYGLRDYGTAQWEGGDEGCDHKHQRGGNGASSRKQVTSEGTQAYQYSGACPKCGAVRIDQQIGLEETPEQYVERLVAVFREVRRVLHPTGTLWLNLGDSYAANGHQGGSSGGKNSTSADGGYPRDGRYVDGLKPKDLIGIPWMVAFALRADGWYLRSEIIWHKPNPMPESVRDRPTKSHEQIFLLSKGPRYFYDKEAIAEPSTGEMSGNLERKQRPNADVLNIGAQAGSVPWDGRSTRNKRDVWSMDHSLEQFVSMCVEAGVDFSPVLNGDKRDVWTITTRPFPGAHFATFPPELPRTCILAGTSEKGCCPECGNPWERVVDHVPEKIPKRKRSNRVGYESIQTINDGDRRRAMNGQEWAKSARTSTLGWRPTCDCGFAPVPQTVLDIFNGSGTSGQEAVRLGREYIGIDLNPEYLEMTRKRLEKVQMEMSL